MESTDSFFDQPPGRDDPGFVVNGRYAIKHPETGKPSTWQRASNFGAPLADQNAISRWQKRELIRGLNLREDLIELIRTATEITNAQADEWAAMALAAAAADAKANRGTAVHEVLAAYDSGRQYSERYAHIVHGYGSELNRHGLTPVAWEVVVLNVPLGAAGRLDRIYREREGSYVLGDVKTGRLDYAIHEFAVQLAVYNTAKYLVDDTGSPKPLPWVLRQDYAVLVHVDPVTGESSTYRIDMPLSLRAANLAVQVRSWRSTKDVALPYVPPDAATREVDAQWANAGLASDLNRVVEVDAPPADLSNRVGIAVDQVPGGIAATIRHSTAEQNLPDDHPGREANESVAAYHARLADEDNRAQAFGHHTQTSAVPVESRPPHYDTKTGEQRIRPDGVTVYFTGQDWEPVNPVQAANLAVPGDGPRAGMAAIVHGEHAPNMAATIAANEPRDAGVPHPSHVEHPELFAPTGQPIPARPFDPTPDESAAFGGPVPAIDPEVEAAELAKLPKAELQRMLKALGGTDLAHHRSWLAHEIVKRKNAAGHPDIVTVGTNAAGERAVTIDQRPVAPVAAAEQTPHTLALIGAAGSVADLSRIRDKIVSVGGDKAWTDQMTEAARARAAVLDEGDRQSVLARIAGAGSSQELAALWAELTLSGTAPSHWTAEYQEHATAQLNAINSTNVAAPPVNPFAQ